MKFKLGELDIVIPYNCIFRQQHQFLQYLYQQFITQKLIAVQVPQSEAKIKILFSFFLAYLSSDVHQQRIVLYYLPKTNKQAQSLFQSANQLLKLRQMEGILSKNQINICCNMNVNLDSIQGPIFQIITQQKFFIYLRDHEDVIKGKTIIYFSEVSTLDIDCQNAMSFQINQTTLRKAAIQKRFLQKQVRESVKDIEYDYRKQVQNIVNTPKTQFLTYNTLFINCIQYIIGYLKTKQKQLHSSARTFKQSREAKEPFSKKLTEICSQWTKQLFLSPDIINKMSDRFLQLISQFKIDYRNVQSIGIILEFLKNLVNISTKYDQNHYSGAFKCIVNVIPKNERDLNKTKLSTIFSFKICCFEPRIMFDKIFILSRRKKQNNIMLVLSSSAPINKDFFLNNFHISVNSKVFCDKQTQFLYDKNVLGMMINSNAFVDLRSDNYDSQIYNQIKKQYGTLIVQFSEVITDGIIVYVSSAKYLSALLEEWQKQIDKDKDKTKQKHKIIDRLRKHKCIFVESQKQEVNKMNIKYYKQACDVGRGAIFFLTCRSKTSQIEQFTGHYSNAVIFLGYPQLNQQELFNKQKMHYLHNKGYLKDKFLYLQQQAMRHVNKCLSRTIINNKIQKKIVLFIDQRFNSRLIPKWISINQGNLNITESIQKTKQFNRYNPKRQISKIIEQTIQI